jgi:hypothetical protein
MTEVPQVFAIVSVTVEQNTRVGVSAEGLPPKWFTKNPSTTFDQDLVDMKRVIGHAAMIADRIAKSPIGYFDFWRELYQQTKQLGPGRTNSIPSRQPWRELDRACCS